MNKIIYLLGSLILLGACTVVDNYTGPAATLVGTVIDSETGSGFCTEQPNGFRISYKELSDVYPSAQKYYFYGKADGSFNNSKVFAGTYEVQAVEGAFVTPDAQTVTLSDGNNPEVTFRVTPYLTISGEKCSFDASSKTLHVEFVVGKPSASPANPASAFVSVTWNPNVSFYAYGNGNNQMAVNGGRISKSVSASDLDKTLSFEIDCSALTTGHTWYVRVGCSSDKNTSRANMAPAMKFEY